MYEVKIALNFVSCHAIVMSKTIVFMLLKRKHFDSMTFLTGCWWIVSVEFCAWSVTQVVCRPMVGVYGRWLVME